MEELPIRKGAKRGLGTPTTAKGATREGPIPVGLQVRIRLRECSQSVEWIRLQERVAREPPTYLTVVVTVVCVPPQEIVRNLHERTWSSLDLHVVQER
jgi:hypothetical protein